MSGRKPAADLLLDSAFQAGLCSLMARLLTDVFCKPRNGHSQSFLSQNSEETDSKTSGTPIVQGPFMGGTPVSLLKLGLHSIPHIVAKRGPKAAARLVVIVLCACVYVCVCSRVYMQVNRDAGDKAIVKGSCLARAFSAQKPLLPRMSPSNTRGLRGILLGVFSREAPGI